MGYDLRSLEDNLSEDFREKTMAVGFVPIQTVEDSPRTAAFTVIGGSAVGRSFALSHEESMIGRHPECTIYLDDDGVSRNHAKVVRAEDQWVLLDLGSTNGTYHDGERIQVLTLEDGDKVQFGLGTILRFEYQDVMDERYQRSMYESKTRDPLTQAYNRGYFMEAIDREVAYALRHTQTLSLVLFDLDRFKQVNDTHGHTAGDTVLKEISRAVRDRVRKEDIFARYGGEEFALLLRNTEPAMAFVLAERVRRAIEKLEIVHDGRKIPCTISMGISHTDAGTAGPKVLIDAADERLYRAKAGGRNRIESPALED